MKKKLLSLVLLLALILTACGNAAAAQWQEQYDLGVRYLSEGDFENAIVAFQAAIEIDPKRAEAYVGVARAYVGLGDEASAIEWLQKGMEAARDTGEIAAMLTELGVEVPEAAAAVEDGAEESAASGEQSVIENVAVGQNSDTYSNGLGTESGRDWITIYGDEVVAQLLQQGMDREALAQDDNSAFGIPLSELTMESLQGAATGQGLEFYSNEYMLTANGYTPIENGASGRIFFNAEFFEEGEQVYFEIGAVEGAELDFGYPTGIRNLLLGDSLEEALRKFSFSNAGKIAAYWNAAGNANDGQYYGSIWLSHMLETDEINSADYKAELYWYDMQPEQGVDTVALVIDVSSTTDSMTNQMITAYFRSDALCRVEIHYSW